jgi:BASS family bile acid:Na+ symporter
LSEITQFFESTFALVILIFTVANLFVIGIQGRMPEVIAALKNKTSLALIFGWGWVLGPALAYLITRVLPLAEPYVIVVLLCSLAPCAPFLPPMVKKARGDVSFAGAFVPLAVIGTVVLMPLLAPLLIKGVTISAVALAKPLFLTLLVPVIIGMAVRHFAGTVATKIFPVAMGFAVLTTVLTITWSFVLYWRQMLDTAGSFALLAMTIFMVVMGLITYRFGFGLKQNQRSVMSLGMLTRNFAAVLTAALTIPDLDPLTLTMIIMWVLWSVVLSATAARIFGKQAGNTLAGNTI